MESVNQGAITQSFFSLQSGAALSTSTDIGLLRTIAKKPELCLRCSCTMQAFFQQHFFLSITKGINDYTYETENENQRRIWRFCSHGNPLLIRRSVSNDYLTRQR
uniref:Uncharacterized protein n=1 Tax=Glossina pallidipes TaxID=7398 RepID=A0A1B0A3G3_GLOPL